MASPSPRLLALYLCALLACTTPDGPPDGFDDDLGDEPPPPQEPEPPFAFDVSLEQFGAGTQIAIGYRASVPVRDLRLVVADPDVVEVEIDVLDIRAHGLAPGRTSILAQSGDGSESFDELEVVVSEVESIELYFLTSPIAPRPIGRLSGLVGSRDSLKIVYRSAEGYQLRGRGTFSVEGAAVAIDPSEGSGDRISEGYEPGERVHLHFVEEGSAVLTAAVADGRSTSVPIEVIEEPASIELVSMVRHEGGLIATESIDPILGARAVEVGQPIGVDVVGHDAAGTFVAGVTASWSIDSPVIYWSGEGRSSEIVILFADAGLVNIGAAATANPAITASHWLFVR